MRSGVPLIHAGQTAVSTSLICLLCHRELAIKPSSLATTPVHLKAFAISQCSPKVSKEFLPTVNLSQCSTVPGACLKKEINNINDLILDMGGSDKEVELSASLLQCQKKLKKLNKTLEA